MENRTGMEKGLAMKAVTINDFEMPPALRDDLPEPTAAASEVLVRVKALISESRR
jgi:hypothetical protein